jgi:hypothetical protein
VIIRSRAVCGALAFALLVPHAAAAQTPRNPFAELFGRTPERSGCEFTSVLFRATSGAQSGRVVSGDRTLTGGGAEVPEGWSGGADASLTAQYMRDRVQLVGQGRYSYQEYRQPPAFGVPAFDAGFRAEVKPTTRLMLHGTGNFARSPYYDMVWMTPNQAGSIAPVDRSAILMMKNDTIQGSAGITSRYTQRSSLEFMGTIRETKFEFQPQQSFSAVGGHAQWRRQMTRDLAFRVGYGREELRQHAPEGDLVFTNEVMDIGVDYSKALSLARRTSLSFGTQTSMVRDDGERHYRLNGQIRLEKRFQRTWEFLVGARRGTDFLPGFRAPVLTEQGSVTLSGYLAKRLILNAEAIAGRGEVGFHDDRRFATYTGYTKLTFALTRRFGVFGQYAYYHYENPPDAQTLFLIPRGAREAIAIGVQTWFSIYDKEKVPSDSR